MKKFFPTAVCVIAFLMTSFFSFGQPSTQLTVNALSGDTALCQNTSGATIYSCVITNTDTEAIKIMVLKGRLTTTDTMNFGNVSLYLNGVQIGSAAQLQVPGNALNSWNLGNFILAAGSSADLTVRADLGSVQATDTVQFLIDEFDGQGMTTLLSLTNAYIAGVGGKNNEVINCDPPVFVSADAQSTCAGHGTYLSWTTLNANHVTIVGDGATVIGSPNGYFWTNELCTGTWYTLTAYGVNGQSVSRSLYVWVDSCVGTHLQINPQTVPCGYPTDISWYVDGNPDSLQVTVPTQNGNTVTFPMPLNSHLTTMAITDTQTYIISTFYTHCFNLVKRDTVIIVPFDCPTTTGILSLSEQKLTLLPNPATESVTIKNMPLDRTIIEIFAADGSLILTKETWQTRNVKIDITSLPTGAYLLRTQTNATSISTLNKFVKQ